MSHNLFCSPSHLQARNYSTFKSENVNKKRQHDIIKQFDEGKIEDINYMIENYV